MSVTCKAVFIATSAVTLVCVLLFMLWMVMTPTWVIESRRARARRPMRPYSNSSLVPSPGDEANSNSNLTQHDPQLSPSVISKTQCTPIGENVSVLGKQPERCTTSGADDIYISIKTTQRYHKTRVLMLILTWLQTVKPEQVNSIVSCFCVYSKQAFFCAPCIDPA